MAERERFFLNEIYGKRDAVGRGIPNYFDCGISGVPKTHPLFMFGQQLPQLYHRYFNDFDNYVAADWTVTVTQAGSGDAAEALTDVDGGVLLLTCDNADNDNVFLQKVGEGFRPAAGKQMFFDARWKTVEATQVDLVIGLQITDTSPLAVSDGIFFQKDDGDKHLDLHVVKDTTDTATAAIVDIADDTWITTQFWYDGVSKIWYGVNGVFLGSCVTTNLPDDEDLTVSFGIQQGEATNIKTLSLDYLFVAKAR